MATMSSYNQQYNLSPVAILVDAQFQTSRGIFTSQRQERRIKAQKHKRLVLRQNYAIHETGQNLLCASDSVG